MNAQGNPFTPGFGQVPLYMAGRDYMIRDIVGAFEGNGYDPNLTSIFIGARGTGKTALMTLLADEAEPRGWITARVSSIPGMLDDILLRAKRAGRHLLSPKRGHLTSLEVGGVLSAGWETAQEEQKNWRLKMDELLDELERHDTGLLITVDEVRSDFDEMVQLASVYQHFLGEGRRVALLMAGLPFHVSRILSDKSISFLRRASSQQLGRIENVDVRLALKQTVQKAGRTIAEDALDAAVAAVDGFPYMLQLVGYRAWGQNADAPEISRADAQEGARLAQRELETRILEPTYNELSNGDIRFIKAMLADEGTSRVADMAERLQVSSGYAAQYRRRLMEQGIISQRARGVIAFDLPGWREFMREKLQ